MSVGLAMGLYAWWGFAGSGLRSQGGSGEEGLSRCALGRKGCSPPMFAPARPRGRPVAGVVRGVGPLWRRVLCVRRFRGLSVCEGGAVGLATGLCAWSGWAGPGLRSQGGSGPRRGFRAARWGRKGVRLQCSLRPGPAGARWLGWCWGWGRCGGGCSVCAGSVGCRFVWVVSVGLAMGLCAWWGFAGSGLRSQGGSGEEGLSRCALGIKGVRLQCSLQPGPAGARLGAASQWPPLSGNAERATRPVRPALLRGRGPRG